MPKPPKLHHRVKPIKPVKDPSKLRITTPVKTAIDAMIHDGLTRSQAAQLAGIKDHSLYVALCKPHVLEYKNRVLREFRESLAEKSLSRMDGLADNADKDSTKFQANKFLIEQDQRFTPTSKQIIAGQIEHKFTPGYVIDLSDCADQVSTQQVFEAEIIEDVQGDS